VEGLAGGWVEGSREAGVGTGLWVCFLLKAKISFAISTSLITT